ncbi:MAG: hypothetical protein M0Q44_05175 [Methylobacter sp.]|jgi:hypothetical protein|nr:hypothetical protein [Methylobacter sp.]
MACILLCHEKPTSFAALLGHALKRATNYSTNFVKTMILRPGLPNNADAETNFQPFAAKRRPSPKHSPNPFGHEKSV